MFECSFGNDIAKITFFTVKITSISIDSIRQIKKLNLEKFKIKSFLFYKSFMLRALFRNQLNMLIWVKEG